MKYAALGDVTKIDRKVATSHECETLPYVGLEHIESKTGHLTRDFRMQSEKLGGTKFSFNHNHVLYGKLRPYLDKRLRPNFAGVCSTELMPISPKPVIDRSFLFFALSTRSFVSWASNNVSGANLPRLPPSILEEYLLPLPSLEEQRRIAGILERADRLRRLRLHALEISDTYLQSVFLEMFGDVSDNRFQFLVSEIQDVSSKLITYGIVQAGPHIEGGVPYIRTGDIKDGKILVDQLLCTSTEIAKSYQRSAIATGDIVMSIRATVGTLAETPRELNGANLTQGTARISPSSTTLGKYLLWALRSSAAQSWINEHTKGATFREITLAALRELPILNPPLELQRKFARVVQRHERLRAQQLEGVRLAQGLYDALLHDAFAG